MLPEAFSQDKPDAPEQILARWTWRLARATRKAQDRAASAEYAEAKQLLGALANSRGTPARGEMRQSSPRRLPASSPCRWRPRSSRQPRATPPGRRSFSTRPGEDLGIFQNVAVAESLPRAKATPPGADATRLAVPRSVHAEPPRRHPRPQPQPQPSLPGRKRRPRRSESRRTTWSPIDRARCLHQRVARGRPCKKKKQPLEILAHRPRLLRLSGKLAQLAGTCRRSASRRRSSRGTRRGYPRLPGHRPRFAL